MKILRMPILLLILLLAVACAQAECATPSTVEAGRSPVPTCPMISFDAYIANTRGTTNVCGAACADDDLIARCSIVATCGNCGDADCEGCANESAPPLVDGHYTTTAASLQEQVLAEWINEEREANGLSALPLDGALSALAKAKSQDMVEDKYFAHTSPTLGSAADMLDAAGYDYVSVGENIARSGSVEKAHAALMSSTNHRRNILGSQWTRFGVGIVNDANGYTYVTELFAR